MDVHDGRAGNFDLIRNGSVNELNWITFGTGCIKKITKKAKQLKLLLFRSDIQERRGKTSNGMLPTPFWRITLISFASNLLMPKMAIIQKLSMG